MFLSCGGNVYLGKYENLDLYSVMNINIKIVFWFCLCYFDFWKMIYKYKIDSVYDVFIIKDVREILCILKM